MRECAQIYKEAQHKQHHAETKREHETNKKRGKTKAAAKHKTDPLEEELSKRKAEKAEIHQKQVHAALKEAGHHAKRLTMENKQKA